MKLYFLTLLILKLLYRGKKKSDKIVAVDENTFKNNFEVLEICFHFFKKTELPFFRISNNLEISRINFCVCLQCAVQKS